MMSKKLFLSLAASAVVSSAVFAAPTMATDGTGDLLIAPAYFTTGSYGTTLKVVNTNRTDSIIIRAVIRDSVCSREVDFPILLSPGDAWEGTITADATGQALLTSKDDSNYPGFGIENGVVLSGINKNAEGKFTSGYVEFLPIAQYEDNGTKVDKPTTLKTRFDNLAKGITTGAKAVDDDSLTGTVTLVNNTSKLSMTLPMTAVENANEVVVKAGYMALGTDTNYIGFLENVDGTNNEIALMNLLKKSSISIPYSNGGANSLVNFTHWNDGTCTTNGQTRIINPTTSTVYDMSENKPGTVSNPTFSGAALPITNALVVKNELGQLLVSDVLKNSGVSYSDGWVSLVGYLNYSGTSNLNVVNQAATVIPTYMTAVKVGDSYTTNWMYLPFGK